MGAQRSAEARVFAALGLTAIAVAGCGGGTRQDANEPSGNFPIDVLSASFPDQQRLATTSNMVITVRNAGTKKIPSISVTVKCYPGRNGKLATGSLGTYDQQPGGGFGYRSTYPGNADPSRPQFVVNTIPTRTPRNYDNGRLDPLERSSAYVDTYPLGPLAAGGTVTFRWNVTAVKSGPYRICYRVNAGLAGKAKAVPAQQGGAISGVFTGEVSQKPPQAHIAENGHTVVEGSAQSGNTP
jgi:hypothetical protein